MLSAKVKIIKDVKIRNAFFDFFSKVNSNSLVYSINPLISVYKDVTLDNLNWEKLCDIVYQIDSVEYNSRRLGLHNLRFIQFLIDSKLYTQDHLDYLKSLIDDLVMIPGGSRIKRLKIFDTNTNFKRFIIVKYNSGGNKFTLPVDTKIDNEFIVDLLDKFYQSNSFSNRTTGISFAERFIESYDDFSDFKDISDFNYSVFKKQFNFFKNNDTELKALIKFYIYLYMSSEYNELFEENDPIDTVWLQKFNFAKYYGDGFELVNLNPFEPVPSSDKWVIKPNGLENASTLTKSTSYMAMDFTKINYDKYRYYVKFLFWNFGTTLKTRKDTTLLVMTFLNFIYEYKSNNIKVLTEGINYKKITPMEVYSFCINLENSPLSQGSYNQYMYAIRTFLDVCSKNNFLDIDSSVFEFLAGRGNYRGSGGESIPEDDLIILEEHLRNIAEQDNNLEENLYYIIFHLAIETELRISQLLSLKVSEIVEGMKRDQFSIKSITKTSNGEKIDQPISAYAKRHIDVAIRYTQSLRDDAISKFDDYIFLKAPESKCSNKDISPIELKTFNYYLKKKCTELGIKEYTAANLRDTHMTKAVEFGFKHGLSDLAVSKLTNHVKSTTTNNYYVDFRARTFAEATFGVIIGDIDIKGNILSTTNTTFTNEETVDDNCGFCKETECKILNELGCPMCDGFVVTLDRIPYYEKKIKGYDNAIEKQEISHEKEHLLAQKRLYVAYLTQLYSYKEEVAKVE